MENFGSIESTRQGFNSRAKEEGLVSALESFELLAGKQGQRIQIEESVFTRYSPAEKEKDIAESGAFFRKYYQGTNAQFRPSMLAEELVKVGGSFGLFGDKAEVMQSSQYDDYKNNADFIVEIPTDYRDKKDEKLLRPKTRFVIDVTTDGGDRLNEKLANLSAELNNGKLTDIKYFPKLGGSLNGIPRFVLEVDEELLLEFFNKAKASLDRAGGVDEKRFAEQYDWFSRSANKKIAESIQAQVTYVMERAVTNSLPKEIAERTKELLSSPLGGFYQTLEYLYDINVESFSIADEGQRKNTTAYLEIVKKLLGVGASIERVMEEKEKRASTQQVSEALH